MKDRAKLSVRNDGISRWFRLAISGALALVMTFILTSAFDLPGYVGLPIVIALGVGAAVLVNFKPRLVLSVVCALLFFIGVELIILAPNKEVIESAGWDPSLLGAGASIVAIAIALYTLLVQVDQGKERVNLNVDEKKIPDLKEGYVWIEKIKKFRCEYCKGSGSYRYYKTLSGVKGHIAREHGRKKI